MTLTRDEVRPARTGTADDTHPALWISRPSVMASVWPWLAAIAALTVLPFVFSSDSGLSIMNLMAINIVFALSYNMLLGQGGMLSFGHAVYMGLGGFACVHLMNRVEYDEWWIPLPLLPILGGLFGAFFAFLIGSFQTRRAGTVFAMISLGIGELVAACSIIIVAFFGGEEGISADRTYGPTVFGWDFATKEQVYVLTCAWMVIAALLMFLFSRTPMGRLANAVRDNEERAEFLGYSQRNVRWISFTLSGFFAGIAGALFAINFEILTEENLNLVTSGTILLMAFLGGIGFFIGPVVGVVVFTLMQTVLGLYTDLWALYAGLVFVLTVMFFPQGLTGLVAMHAEPWRERRLGHMARPYALALVPMVLFVLGFAAICEIALHIREAGPGASRMTLYWVRFDSHAIWPMATAVAVTLASAFALWKIAPTIREAWDVSPLERS